MESIEERADKYLQSQGLFRGACASQISYGAGCMYDGYIQGATEQKTIDEDAIHAIVEEQVLKAIEKQKAIDIDKACEWLRSNYADAEYSPFLVKFRKAMEEDTK